MIINVVLTLGALAQLFLRLTKATRRLPVVSLLVPPGPVGPKSAAGTPSFPLTHQFLRPFPQLRTPQRLRNLCSLSELGYERA